MLILLWMTWNMVLKIKSHFGYLDSYINSRKIFSMKFLNTILFSGFAFAMLISGCRNYPTNGSRTETSVSFSNSDIAYQGRVDTRGQEVTFYWPGTSAKILLQGQGAVYALLKDEKGENYYNIILDNDSIRVLHPNTTKRYYLLAANLPDGKHSVEIFKRTEWDKGSTEFYGFKLEGNLQVVSPARTKHLKLEFYGNSITAGYAVDDVPTHSHPDSIYTNNYDSFAAITARYFNADYRAICKGGIGIMISWFPLTMPEMYNRLNPTDSSSRWNFSEYTPDIVVINLFQNDSWLVKRPSFSEFKKKFGNKPPKAEFIVNAYKQFVASIRGHYPNAKIICMLGNMDITRKSSPWPGYVQAAVRQLHDKNIYTLFVPYKNTPGHPGIKEQQVLADSLIDFIHSKTVLQY